MVIRSDKMRWLFWLRWRLFLRKFSAGKGRVGRIFSMLALFFSVLLFSSIIALLFVLSFRVLPAPINTELLFILLCCVYLFWVLSPLVGYNTNEGLDLAKLSPFPLSRAELMLSLIITTVFDAPTVGLAVVLASVVAGWALSLPLTLFTLLAMCIFYVQLVSSSQLALALLMNFLQSRRFRDLAVLVAALLSFVGYLGQFIVNGFRSSAANMLKSLRHTPFSPYLQWSPPGMSARAIQLAATGHWLLAFCWLAASLVVSCIFLYCWLLMVEHMLVSSADREAARPRRVRLVSPGLFAPSLLSSLTTVFARIIPWQSLAILIKDARYFWRDPQFKVRYVRAFLTIFILIAYVFFDFSTDSFFGHWRLLYLPFAISFSLAGLTQNIFGYERQSVTSLFIFPADSRTIFWGKNLLVVLLGILEICVATVAMVFFSHDWHLILPTFVACLASFGVILGFGNISSVLFPTPTVATSRDVQRTTKLNLANEQGCLYGLKAGLTLLIELVVLVPILAALFLPMFLNLQWLWSFSLLFAAAYGAGVYIVLTHLSAVYLTKHFPEILERVSLFE